MFQRLAVALAVGLLIGIERGWHERGAGEGPPHCRAAHRGELAGTAAVQAIVIAACVNTLVKGLIVAFICRSTMAWQVMSVFRLTVTAGAAITLFTV